jgi:hypothetical protein
MRKNTLDKRVIKQDVAAIVTAMTDHEQPFLFQAIEAVIADPCIGQIVLCIEEQNAWINTTLGDLKDDPRLVIVKMQLACPGAVRDRALEYVKLPWVTYCDGDDIWCSGKTLEQRFWADATNSDFVGADHYLMNEGGKICAFAFARHIPMLSSWLVRTEIMRRYPFRDSMPIEGDSEWWVRTWDVVPKVRYPKMLLKYRVRSDSVSSNTVSKQRKVRFVAIASLPILRETALFLTWCSWLTTRRETYIWLEEWGPQPVFKEKLMT